MNFEFRNMIEEFSKSDRSIHHYSLRRTRNRNEATKNINPQQKNEKIVVIEIEKRLLNIVKGNLVVIRRVAPRLECPQKCRSL